MIIKTYKELQEFIVKMNEREINLVIVESRGGLGKTYSVESMLDDPLIFKGHATPLEVYMTLYRNPNRLVVFDDVDSYLNNKSAVAIMKQMTDTKETKDIHYSTSVTYEGQKVPKSFKSNCRVVILCNKIRVEDKDMKAVLTRGFHIKFVPDNREVYSALCKFAKDKQILGYLNGMLGRIKDFNFRIYELCLQLKRSGMDWRNYLEVEYGEDVETKLLYSIKDYPISERNAVWKRETNKSVRCLQMKLKELKESNKRGKK